MSKKFDKYIINGREIDIIKEDWDIMVILDACRYDFFKEIYKKFFPTGKLYKAISPATWTMEWLNKIFAREYYKDIIYISANNFINPKFEICFRNKYSGKLKFNAKDKFFKVYSTDIHPKNINKVFLMTYLKYPQKRYILHYMQPHQPYVTIGDDKIMERIQHKKPNAIIQTLYLLIPNRIKYRIKKILRMPPSTNEEKIYFKEGWEGIIRIYKKEIEFVLGYVKRLVDHVNVNWVITSDHGERFYNLILDTHGGRRDREVTEVPWLIINKRHDKQV